MHLHATHASSLAAAAFVLAIAGTFVPANAHAEPPPPAAASAPASAPAPEPRTEPSTRTVFAGEIWLDGQTYRLRGVALRRVHVLVFPIDVYAIGYYASPTDERLKAFKLVAARDLSRSRIVKALADALEKKLGSVPAAARPMLDAMVDSPKGEATYYYSTAPGELTVRQGRRVPLTVRDASVTSAVFDQWISPKYAITEDMQKSLTGGR